MRFVREGEAARLPPSREPAKNVMLKQGSRLGGSLALPAEVLKVGGAPKRA